jgi:hypothetical protein
MTEQAEGELTTEFVEGLTEEQVHHLESDTYWCLEKLTESIQDNYTDKQPGVYACLKDVAKIVSKKDQDLIDMLALADYGITKFAYRWVNCILTREFPMANLVRIWDTLLSEEMELSKSLTYLCAAMLLMMSDSLKEFSDRPDEIIMYLQDPPT